MGVPSAPQGVMVVVVVGMARWRVLPGERILCS